MACPKDNQLTLDYWQDRWIEGQTGFHEPGGSVTLKELLPSVLKGVCGDQIPTDLKVLIPLCGKTQDLLMFYNLGYQVAGTEYSQTAIDEFFYENNLVNSSNSDGPLNTTDDKRLTIVRGDHFQTAASNLLFPPFDIVWDRGAFEALNQEDRYRYAKQMTSLLKTGTGIYILKTVQYDTSEYGGPPLAASQHEVEEYFSDMTVKPLVTQDLFQPAGRGLRFKDKGITKMDETFFLLQRK